MPIYLKRVWMSKFVIASMLGFYPPIVLVFPR